MAASDDLVYLILNTVSHLFNNARLELYKITFSQAFNTEVQIGRLS